MSSFTPLLPPAKPSPNSSPSKGKWRSWTTPIDRVALTRALCGYLNKLTSRNFDVIAHRIAQLAWAVELSEDRDTASMFVRSVFHRGVTEHGHPVIYALLCRRIVDVLEAERSRWRKVDVLHIGNPFRSFETVTSLLVVDEFNRTRAANHPGELERLVWFLGELLVHGVLSSNDVGDIVTSLFDGVARNDEHLAIVACRFLSPMTSPSNVFHILQSLRVADLIEGVLNAENLSPMVRYLMMGMLDRVTNPESRNTLSPPAPRHTNVYDTSLDEYYIDEDDNDADIFSDEGDVEENDHMQRDCEEWAKSFMVYHDHHYLGNILHSLRIQHRKQLMRCLISAALHSDTVLDARHVGSLYIVPRIFELCFNGQILIEALREELAMLQDVRLDVPNVTQLMAEVLSSTTLPNSQLEPLIAASMDSQSKIARDLANELRRVEQGRHMGEEVRINRFERTSSSTSTSSSCMCTC